MAEVGTPGGVLIPKYNQEQYQTLLLGQLTKEESKDFLRFLRGETNKCTIHFRSTAAESANYQRAAREMINNPPNLNDAVKTLYDKIGAKGAEPLTAMVDHIFIASSGIDWKATEKERAAGRVRTEENMHEITLERKELEQEGKGLFEKLGLKKKKKEEEEVEKKEGAKKVEKKEEEKKKEEETKPIGIEGLNILTMQQVKDALKWGAKQAQQKPKEVEYIQKMLGVNERGVYDIETVGAVAKFQKEHGLIVDGTAGPKTQTQLATIEREKNKQEAAAMVAQKEKKAKEATNVEENKPSAPSTKGIQFLKMEQVKNALSKGAQQIKQNPQDVEFIQIALGIKERKVYDTGTVSAVAEFQKKHNLSVDGIAGPQTLAAIKEEAKKKDEEAKKPAKHA